MLPARVGAGAIVGTLVVELPETTGPSGVAGVLVVPGTTALPVLVGAAAGPEVVGATGRPPVVVSVGQTHSGVTVTVSVTVSGTQDSGAAVLVLVMKTVSLSMVSEGPAVVAVVGAAGVAVEVDSVSTGPF